MSMKSLVMLWYRIIETISYHLFRQQNIFHHTLQELQKVTTSLCIYMTLSKTKYNRKIQCQIDKFRETCFIKYVNQSISSYNNKNGNIIAYSSNALSHRITIPP